MITKRMFSRRDFLRLTGLAAAGTALAACAREVEKVVTKEVEKIVTKEVEKIKEVEKVITKEVEKVVTNTPIPTIKTIHGRELPPDAAPLDKQVYYTSGSEPKHLDPARDIYNAGGTNLGTEPLLRNDENMNLVPALAESWKPGPNVEYWEFVIRKDAKWSDGSPITADDVVYTYRHLSSPKLDTPWVWYYYDIKGIKAHKEGKGKPEDIGVVKVDDRTVRIYGEGPVPHLPALLSYQAAVIVPKARAEKDPEHWSDTVEGYLSSGPFTLVKWDHDKRQEWEANPYYNGPHKPGVQKVVVILGPPTTVWFNAWLNKEIDLMISLSPAEVAHVRSDPKLNPLLRFFNNFQSEYLAFDTMNPPLNNLKLRQALSHAIDRDTLCQSVLNGTAVPGFSMLPPGFPGYNPELKEIQKYDVELAKKLLAEAGYPDGKDSSGKQFELEMFSNGRDVRCEFAKEQWEKNLGIKVKLEVLEGAVWAKRRAEHSMMIYKGPYEYDYLDPANMLTALWRSVDEKGSPRHAWKNDKFDELVTAAGKEVDNAKRMAMYQEAEKILVSEVAAVFLSHNVIFQIWWPYIVGIHPDKNGNVVFRWLDISLFQMYISKDVDQYRKPH